MILELDSVSKRYGKVEAMKEFSLSVSEGERFAILGPNGAGKTTSISMIATLLRPDSGSIRVSGHDVQKERKRVRGLIGLGPQDVGLYPSFSAIENLKYFGHLHGLRGAELERRIGEVLEIAGLVDEAKKRVLQYSGRMRRRLNLAVGLLHRPALLLLDEPTAGVDPQSRNRIIEDLRAINQSTGMTIVYTTHYMEEVETLCDRVAIIDHGELVVCDRVANLLRSLGTAVILARVTAGSERLVDAIRGQIGARQLSASDGLLQLGVDNARDALPELLRLADCVGATVEDIQVRKPSLEQVFLSLTGRGLRD
ncbi:MAG: ATP-binding cassette domain-containing protein [Dehalococcoidia bacterium]|nr:ATP-binding cassette domain-containing protein [Dehalococcoidia bacterium]